MVSALINGEAKREDSSEAARKGSSWRKGKCGLSPKVRNEIRSAATLDKNSWMGYRALRTKTQSPAITAPRRLGVASNT